MAIAGVKPEARALATGLECCYKMLYAIVRAERIEVLEKAGVDPEQRDPEDRVKCHHHETLVQLGALYSCFLDYLGLASLDDMLEIKFVQLFRAMYMELIVFVQEGHPCADFLGINVQGLAGQMEMSLTELYDLVERESLRPGCQFGVQLYEMRVEARTLVYEQRAEDFADDRGNPYWCDGCGRYWFESEGPDHRKPSYDIGHCCCYCDDAYDSDEDASNDASTVEDDA